MLCDERHGLGLGTDCDNGGLFAASGLAADPTIAQKGKELKIEHQMNAVYVLSLKGLILH